MFKSIGKILGAALSIWDSKQATKYQKLQLKLEKAYDEENDKDSPDHNILDRYERDILRLSNLVATEIKRS